jgi:hypothetical protein
VFGRISNLIEVTTLSKCVQYQEFQKIRSNEIGNIYTGVPELPNQVFVSRNGGKKRSEKYSGCNSFLGKLTNSVRAVREN